MNLKPVNLGHGYEHMFDVDCKGRGGGLILLWRDSVHLKIQNYNIRHINVVI